MPDFNLVMLNFVVKIISGELVLEMFRFLFSQKSLAIIYNVCLLPTNDLSTISRSVSLYKYSEMENYERRNYILNTTKRG